MRDLVVTGDMFLPLSIYFAEVRLSLLLDGEPAPAEEYFAASFTWLNLENNAFNQIYLDASGTPIPVPHGRFTFWGRSATLMAAGTDHVALFGTCEIAD